MIGRAKRMTNSLLQFNLKRNFDDKIIRISENMIVIWFEYKVRGGELA
jgi:hypothetical protein